MTILIKEIRKSERTAELVKNLLEIWEKSVRATHTFLQEEEILKIKEYVPDAILNVETLLILCKKNEDFQRLGFMGIENKKIKMLFLLPDEHGKGFGKMLVQHGVENYSAEKVTPLMRKIRNQRDFTSILDSRCTRQAQLTNREIRIRLNG